MMQEFSHSVFSAAVAAIWTKTQMEFQLPRELTSFSKDPAPADWASYPPAALPENEYNEIMTKAAGDGLKGELIILEIRVHQAGGRTFYKAVGNDKVGVRITWP